MSSSSRPSTTPFTLFAADAKENAADRMHKIIGNIISNDLENQCVNGLILALSRPINPEQRRIIWERLEKFRDENAQHYFLRHLEDIQYFSTMDERRDCYPLLLAAFTESDPERRIYLFRGLAAYIKNTIDSDERMSIFNDLIELFKKNINSRLFVLQDLLLPLVDTLSSQDLECLLPIIRHAVVGDEEDVLEQADQFLLKAQRRHLISAESLAKHSLPLIQSAEKQHPLSADFKLEISTALDSKCEARVKETACRKLEDHLNEKNTNQITRNVLTHISEQTDIDKASLERILARGFKWLAAKQQTQVQNAVVTLLAAEKDHQRYSFSGKKRASILDIIKVILVQMEEDKQLHFLNRIMTTLNPNVFITQGIRPADRDPLSFLCEYDDIVTVLIDYQACCALKNKQQAHSMQQRLRQDDIAMPSDLVNISFRYAL